MTSWITLLSTIILSSFASVTENSGKVWWPQFRGPNASGLGQGSPPVHFSPDHNVLAGVSRQQYLRENRESPVRFWGVKNASSAMPLRPISGTTRVLSYCTIAPPEMSLSSGRPKHEPISPRNSVWYDPRFSFGRIGGRVHE
jgi:hypothetical protein